MIEYIFEVKNTLDIIKGLKKAGHYELNVYSNRTRIAYFCSSYLDHIKALNNSGLSFSWKYFSIYDVPSHVMNSHRTDFEEIK